MLKRKLYLLIAVIIIAGISPTAYAETSIGINPSRIELDLKQGKTYKKEITVFNQGDKLYNVKAYVRDYTTKGKINSFKKIEADWVKIKPTKFSIKAGQNKKIKVDINIPDAEGSKKKNLVVFFEPQAKGSGVSVIQRVGTIFALNILPAPKTAMLPYYLLAGLLLGIAVITVTYRKRLLPTAVLHALVGLLVISLAGSPYLFIPAKKAYANPGTRTKTIEYFVGQDKTAAPGVAAGADTTFNFSVYLPDIISSPTAIKSAWIEYTFNPTDTIDPGQVQLGLTPQGQAQSMFTSASYTSSDENYIRKIRADFTSTIAGFMQSPGSYNFALRANVAGVSRMAENAKIFITYDYDDAASTQIRTVRYFLGQEAADVGVGNTATFNLGAPGLPESGVTIRSTWSEVTATAVATDVLDSTIQLSYDADTPTDYYISNLGGKGGRVLNLLHGKNITDAAHTFKVTPSTGYSLTSLGAEQVITYTYDYANSSKLLNTMEIHVGTDGAKDATAPFNAAKTINMPETGIAWKSIYLRGSAQSIVDTNFGLAAQLNSAPTPANSASYNSGGGDKKYENLGNYWYLSNETNNLNTMTTGDNNINTSWAISAGAATSRSVILVLTYEADKNSSTVNASSKYFVGQNTAYSTGYAPTFNVSIADTNPNVKGSYISADAITGAIQDGRLNLSVQPTNTAQHNWDATGEQLWFATHQDNASNEVNGSGTYTANLDSSRNVVSSGVATVYWQYQEAIVPSLTLTIDETYDINGTLDSSAPFVIGFGTTDPLSQPTYTVRENTGEYAIKFSVQSNVNWEMALEASDDLKDTGGNVIPIADLKTAEDGTSIWSSLVKAPSSFLLMDEEPSTPGASYNYDFRLENIDLDIEAGVGPYETTTIYSLLESTQPGAG